MPRQINPEHCTACGTCVDACPVNAIQEYDDKFQIDPNECVDCQTCERICPEHCVNGGPDKYLDLRSE